MDMISLFQDYGLRRASEGEKHYRPGWINVPCPFCSGHIGNHLGFNIEKEYWKCWRCGYKDLSKVIERLLGISYKEADKVIRRYQGKTKNIVSKQKVIRLKFKMPDDTGAITRNKAAMQYMIEERGFTRADIHWLAKKYQLKAIGDLGWLEWSEKEMDLSFRILAPIYHDLEIVSWQTRDITDNAYLKYITCPGLLEKIEHKHVLYNAPDSKQFPFIILCEGIFDVWKVVLAGFPATCCFGVEYTYYQFLLLKQYKKVFIFMDPDKAGLISSRKLIKQLIFSGSDGEIVKNLTGNDPGDMTKKKIKKILIPYMKLN